jgi:low temperature requirement protein LtrA
VRLLHLVLYAIAGKKDPDLLGAVLRMVPSATLGPALIVAAAVFDGGPQGALWLGALALDYLGVLWGRGAGWRVSPAHFAERHGLIVIIALGESIVAIGIGAAGLPLGTGIVVAALVGIGVVAALWWLYFDVTAIYAQQALERTRGVARATMARDYYSYLHLPLVAGIVLFALGLKKTLEDVGDPLGTVPAVALFGGLSLFFLTHVVQRARLVLGRHVPSLSPYTSWLGRGRPAAAVLLLALLPVALEASALTAVLVAAAVCWAVIVYDVVHYREERHRVRYEPNAPIPGMIEAEGLAGDPLARVRERR